MQISGFIQIEGILELSRIFYWVSALPQMPIATARYLPSYEWLRPYFIRYGPRLSFLTRWPWKRQDLQFASFCSELPLHLSYRCRPLRLRSSRCTIELTDYKYVELGLEMIEMADFLDCPKFCRVSGCKVNAAWLLGE